MSKISGLDESDRLSRNEHIPLIQNGVTKRGLFKATAAAMVPFPSRIAKGKLGRVDNLFIDLAAFRAQPVSNLKSVYGNVTYFWTIGNFQTRPDAIKSDHQSLITGAWIPQDASSIFTQRSPGLASRTVAEKIAERRTVRDFGLGGAIGYNTPVELKTVFPSLPAAQEVYPFVTDLTDTLDWAAIQAALYEAAKDINQRGLVILNEGYWNISRALEMPNFVTLLGEGKGTWINNQEYELVGPQIVNQDPAGFNGATIKSLALVGGDYALKIETVGGVDGLVMEDVDCALQKNANMYFNKLLQTSTFDRVTMGDAVDGLVVEAATTNLVTFNSCQSVRHTGRSIALQTCEGVWFNNHRMEHGVGDTISAMIELDNANAFHFNGGYVEGGNKLFLKEINSNDQVFIGGGVHFTHALNARGFPAPYEMESDGIVHIGDHHVSQGGISPGFVLAPEKMFFTGNGDQLSGNSEVWTRRDKRGGKVSTKTSSPPSGTSFDVFKFTRAAGAAADANHQALSGTISVSLGYLDSNDVPRNMKRLYSLGVSANSNQVMSASTGLIRALDNIDGETTLTFEQKLDATANEVTLIATFTGINVGFPRLLTMDLDFTRMSENDADIIEVEIL